MPSSRPPRPPTVIQGIAGSPGVAVGPVVVLGDLRATFSHRQIKGDEVEAELARVALAVEIAKASLVEVGERVAQGPLGESRAILDAYLAMLGDPFLHEKVERLIRKDRLCAEWAVVSASDEVTRLFGSGHNEDAYIQERKHDVVFVCDRLVRALAGTEPTLSLTEPAVVVARDVSPADTAAMGEMPVLAFVTERGSRTSHTAIMARALEIPAVVGVESPLLGELRTGDQVVVDGFRGVIVVNPTPLIIEDALARAKRHSAFSQGLRGGGRDRPTMTACGELVRIDANIELPEEVPVALEAGAQGIGLYRTEFLYVNRNVPPTEEEQYAVFQRVVEQMDGRPVTLRTFDVGGDKFASAFALPPEMNPALGLRAVRLALRVPDVFLAHLKAMVRAAAHGDVRIMIPMVTSLEEVRQVKRLLLQAESELGYQGPRIRVGMMVEVPAAAVIADVFAREVDFFSIGTNDLVQYALAVDRTSRKLATLASPFDPAIVRLIDNVVRAGATRNIPVALCGAMAQDPLGAVLLVGLGLRCLSMGAGAVPEIKETLSRVTVAECERLAQGALEADTAEAVEELLAGELAGRLLDILTGSVE